ncbi:helix-hairpin-helix domain-containing protein [Alteribacillus bidgolensis]|uniref:Competence protein ComEA n=1 Tax=Alteribacillus bidgolensis TaxID=930129 RepID=A0A1G8NY98_9BACI|nr:helix-hairpin-helix domain-containing protein [Alteribacillus bidgolensis]SDI84958.1 competence protein ComEA [Alteribacillus bidgolensis]
MCWKNPAVIFTGFIVLSSLMFIIYISVPKQETGIKNSSAENEDFFQEFAEDVETDSKEAIQKSTLDEIIVLVDVKGQVQHPGVYELKENSRVIDAIDAAGGLTEQGDSTNVNFAERIYDEMVIYVPVQGETSTTNIQSAEKSDKVRINYADASELEFLTGIGPTKAEAIISYREEYGEFKEIEDLTNVSGIGEKSVEQLMEEATIE